MPYTKEELQKNEFWQKLNEQDRVQYQNKLQHAIALQDAVEVVEAVEAVEAVMGERILPMGVSRDRLVPVLVKAVQELTAKVEELETKLNNKES